MGTPQELTDENGEVVWCNYEWAWGGRYTHFYKEQSLNGCAILEHKLQPIRFQGQFFDIETSLHYNRFRYYDTDVGMFISRDPIGLLGGNNVFQYAPNPVGWVDPWGLACKSTHSGKRGVAKAKYDLEKNGYKILSEEVTIKVNGSRIRADIVAKDGHGNIHVFEVKHKKGSLTENQRNANVYDLSSPSNTVNKIGGGAIKTSQGKKGTFTMDTANKSRVKAIGKKHSQHNATFHILKYE